MFGGGPVGRGCSLSAGWGGEAKLLVEAGLSGSTALPGASLCCSIGSGCPCPATVHETLATALAQDRADRGVWRTLSPQQQALLVLAHLHDNVTYAALARGFVLVRDGAGAVLTRAEMAEAAARLELEFADGRVKVRPERRAAGRPATGGPKGQGSLF